jgi:hypothetical protein
MAVSGARAARYAHPRPGRWPARLKPRLARRTMAPLEKFR